MSARARFQHGCDEGEHHGETVGGKYVDGVDIITCDDDAMITEFRVMIRPLQAINVMHAQMKAMLEQLSS